MIFRSLIRLCLRWRGKFWFIELFKLKRKPSPWGEGVSFADGWGVEMLAFRWIKKLLYSGITPLCGYFYTSLRISFTIQLCIALLGCHLTSSVTLRWQLLHQGEAFRTLVNLIFISPTNSDLLLTLINQNNDVILRINDVMLRINDVILRINDVAHTGKRCSPAD